jgi:hypothetical protein
LLEHHVVARTGDQRTLLAFVADLHGEQAGIEPGQRCRIRRVDGDCVQGNRLTDPIPLAQVERMSRGISKRDPARALGQPRRAQSDRLVGGRLISVGQQVEVELLRQLLARPLRGDMVGSELERDLLPVARPHRDPVIVFVDRLPAGELGIERRLLLDVSGIERGGGQSSCCCHDSILSRPLTMTAVGARRAWRQPAGSGTARKSTAEIFVRLTNERVGEQGIPGVLAAAQTDGAELTASR